MSDCPKQPTTSQLRHRVAQSALIRPATKIKWTMGQLRKRTTLPRILLVTCFLSTWIIFLSKHKHNHQLVELSSSQHHERRRRLDWSSNCPPDLLSTIPNPTLPAIPMLKRPSYLASFPGSGDKIFSKYLVEMISGLSVGEAAVSPSLYKMESGGSSSSFGGGQGEVFGVRTHFPHTSGKLVRTVLFFLMHISRAFPLLNIALT